MLASSSAYRRQLLTKLGIEFYCDSPAINESALPEESAQNLVTRLALQKAQAVAKRHPSAFIIGSDQVAVHPSGIVGKPENHEHAVQQLQEASGAKIRLYTSLVLLNAQNQEYQQNLVPFDVHFRKLDKATIESYLQLEKPYDCSGSLKAEALGIWLIKKFEGDDPNALTGLPLICLIDMLIQWDYPVFGGTRA